MKKLLEYENEEALDLLADIIEPAAEIFSDKRIEEAWKEEKRTKAVSIAIKNHKKSTLAILAALEGVPVEKYKCNILTLPSTVLALLNDAELLNFFKSQVQNMGKTASTPVTENTEDAE